MQYSTRLHLSIAFLFVSFLQLPPTTTAQKYYDFRCYGNYTSAGVYQRNAAVLLQNVTAQGSLSIAATNSYGAAPNQVFAGYFCREDISLSLCHDCLGNASRTIKQMCPDQIAGVIWYDLCTLEFSPVAFSSQFVDYYKIAIRSNQNVSGNATEFNRVVNDTMDKVATAAVADKTHKRRFATLEANFTKDVNVYAVAQCSRVLAAAECGKCLREGIGILPACCSGRDGGRVLFPTCNIRYETFQFYDLGNATSPGFSAGKKKPSHVPAIVGNLMGVAIISSVVALWFRVYRRRKKMADRSRRINSSYGLEHPNDEAEESIPMTTTPSSTGTILPDLNVDPNPEDDIALLEPDVHNLLDEEVEGEPALDLEFIRYL